MNRLNLITLGVRDMKRSLTFYKGLGFETNHPTDNPPDIVMFHNEGTTLSIYPLDALRMDLSPTDPPPRTEGFSGITIAYNCKTKAEVDAVIERAETLGAKILKQPEQVFWGGYSGYFADLDGYVFEVAYSEHFVFDAQNMIVWDGTL